MIPRGTKFIRKTEAGYEHLTYTKQVLIPESGHHARNNEEMLLIGWMLDITDYDKTTHKLVDDSYNDNGTEGWQNTVALTDEELADNAIILHSSLIAFTKEEASRRIVSIIDKDKQRNATARAVELQEIRHENGELTLGEEVELLYIRGIFTDYVKPIRSASDLIEADIIAGNTNTIEEINNHAFWPTF